MATTKAKPKQTKRPDRRRGVAVFAAAVAVMGLAAGYGLTHAEKPYSVANDNTPTESDYAKARLSNAQLAARKKRILAIYAALKMPSDYRQQDERIIPGKQLYSYDKYRTMASSRTYLVPTDVRLTVADLQRRAQAAGFTYLEEPYPGSAQSLVIYKSDRSEYLRVGVSSQPRDDAFRAAAGGDDAAALKLDPNAGPSNVEIKVNLDTNNE